MNKIARFGIVSVTLYLLVSCKPAVDLTSDVTDGWEGYAWGTDQSQMIQELKLQNADSRTSDDMTYVKGGVVRKLGEASVSVEYVFTNNRFTGVSLRGMLISDADEAAAALDTWFGPRNEDGAWKKGLMVAQLLSNDEMYLVLILNTGEISGLNVQLEQTLENIEKARELLEQREATE